MQFVPIPEFPRYQISSDGTILNMNGSIRKTCKLKNGYLQTVFTDKDGVAVGRYVHRLVNEIFNGPPPDDERTLTLHWDGDKQNNDYKNLRWGNFSENVEDARRHGTLQACRRAILTEDQVHAIRADARPSREVAKDYPVGHLAINEIRARRTWGHLADRDDAIPYRPRPRGEHLARYSAETVLAARAAANAGQSLDVIAARLQAPLATVRSWVNRVSWKHI